MAETQTENKRLGVIEHPRVVQFHLSAPAVIVLILEVGNLGFSISVEDLTADIHAPPAEERAVIGGIQACLAVVDAVLGDGVLTAVGVETGDITNGIVVVGVIQHGVGSLETVIDFGIVRQTWAKVGIARHEVACGRVVAEGVEVSEVRTGDAHGIRDGETAYFMIVPAEIHGREEIAVTVVVAFIANSLPPLDICMLIAQSYFSVEGVG